MKFFKLFLLVVLISLYLTAKTTPSLAIGIQITTDNYGATQQTHYIVLNLMNAIACEIVGKSVIPGQFCAGFVPSEGLKLFGQLPNGGALGTLNTTMVAMYQSPPASSSLYLANLGENLGLVRPAYAQVGGTGNSVIAVIFTLWQAFRNIAYLLLIFVFLAVGFMIMFRTRINPQTVVTAQQALPGLILGLILITFSYFIAALIIDFSFIATQLIGFLFTSSLPGATDIAQSSNVFDLFRNFIISTGSVSNLLFGFTQLFLPQVPEVTANQGILALLQGLGNVITNIPDIISALGLTVAGFFVGIIIVIVVILALFIQMLRLVWGLLNAYINIMIFTILGPLIILAAALPGRGNLLGLWFRNLVANVLIFPAVLAAFLFSAVILQNAEANFTGNMPLFDGINPQLLRAMIAIGIVLGTPAIPRTVRDLLGAKGVQSLAGSAQQGITNAAVLTGAVAGPQVVQAWRTSRIERPGRLAPDSV